MESKSQLGNDYLISSNKAEHVKFLFDKKEFKLIKINNICGLNYSDYIEFTDKEILKQGFLDVLEKELTLSKVTYIFFRLIPLVENKKDREKILILLKKKNFKVKQNFSMFINLKEKAENLRKNLRKSYKSLINKEKKKNKILFSSQKLFNENHFNDWINLYSSALLRGGKKLDNETIKLKEKALINNDLFISLAYDGENLLGGMSFNINKYYVSYSAAANNTNIEKDRSRAVGHLLLWETIIELKKSKYSFLDLGSFSENIQNEKLKNINKFKRGFGPQELITNYFEKTFYV
jgi:hypothetical protein